LKKQVEKDDAWQSKSTVADFIQRIGGVGGDLKE
jgi:hypothetical protein